MLFSGANGWEMEGGGLRGVGPGVCDNCSPLTGQRAAGSPCSERQGRGELPLAYAMSAVRPCPVTC